MAGVQGFEPRKCQSQSLMPYRLATPQNCFCLNDLHIISNFFCFVNTFLKKISKIFKIMFFALFFGFSHNDQQIFGGLFTSPRSLYIKLRAQVQNPLGHPHNRSQPSRYPESIRRYSGNIFPLRAISFRIRTPRGMRGARRERSCYTP